jgi:hypothetical protein
MAELNKLDTNVLDRVSQILDNDSAMTTRTGIILTMEMMSGMYKSQNEMIEHVQKQNGRIGKGEAEIEKLKENNILMWMRGNKKSSIFIIIAVLVINSMINWAGLRRPILHALFNNLGIDVPIESIP